LRLLPRVTQLLRCGSDLYKLPHFYAALMSGLAEQQKFKHFRRS